MVKRLTDQYSEDRVIGDGDDVRHQPEVRLVMTVEEVVRRDVLETLAIVPKIQSYLFCSVNSCITVCYVDVRETIA
jgi:hypothetical protein